MRHTQNMLARLPECSPRLPQVSRLLAPKFGGFLTFGALRAGKESAPGQPTLEQLVHIFRLRNQARAALGDVVRVLLQLTLPQSLQGASTRVLGVIGNPVSHSRSPLLHNAALSAAGEDIVYVPLKVDDARTFLANPLFAGRDFIGFSVTIPHKEAVMDCCDEVRSSNARPLRMCARWRAEHMRNVAG